jgi:hypothetical protein
MLFFFSLVFNNVPRRNLLKDLYPMPHLLTINKSTMEKLKINKGRMYRSSDLALDKYADLYKEHTEMNDARQRLKDGLALIEQQQQLQVADNTGLTKAKTALRTDLTQLIMKFSLGLKAYATTQKNTDLIKKAAYTVSDLNKLADPILCDVGALVHQLALDNQEHLQKFFIATGDYALLETQLEELKKAIPQKRQATTISKVSTQKINVSIR